MANGDKEPMIGKGDRPTSTVDLDTPLAQLKLRDLISVLANPSFTEHLKPEHFKPEHIKPEQIKPEHFKPEHFKPEQIKPEFFKPEIFKELAKPEGDKPDPWERLVEQIAERVVLRLAERGGPAAER